jgi:uncharacterized protein YecE (DUF72 family)
MNRDRAPEVRIGTSGWHYKHWVGPFYRADLPAIRFLSTYAEHLDTVEINNTFYRLVEMQTMRHWRDSVPDGFVFAVKASRYITHMKKLRDPQEPIARLMERADLLGDKLGPILFQLPPHWGLNLERLESFVGALPAGYRYAFEFRDASWYEQRVYDLLSKHGAAFCIYDMYDRRTPEVVTADYVYVRMHGAGGPYQGRYQEPDLAYLAGAIKEWNRQGRTVYCYFNNDQHGYAVENALELRAMIDVPIEERRSDSTETSS